MAKQKAVPTVPTKARPPAVMGSDVSASLAARMAADSGNGMEGTDRDSFAIPFIRVLQDLSPQVKSGRPGYIPGAQPGMIFNTVTGELIPGEDGIIFAPCAYQRRFIQWAPRNGDKGGFKGEWMPEDVLTALSRGAELFEGSGTVVKSEEDGHIYLGGDNPKKNDLLADTRSHFGLVLTDSGPVQALLSLSGSQIKKSKQMMGILSAVRINGQTPPTWMSKLRITTVAESNDQGSWYGVRIEAAGLITTEDEYEAGKAFHDIIIAGKAKADYREEDGTEASGGKSGKF